jgi:hypothetical protein
MADFFICVCILPTPCAATTADLKQHGRHPLITDQTWNKTASRSFLPYTLSKTLSEQRGWALQKEQPKDKEGPEWDFVTINPAVSSPPSEKTEWPR